MKRPDQGRTRGSDLLHARAIPPPLRPLLKAYLIGYASTVGPRLLNVLFRQIAALRKRRNTTTTAENSTSPSQSPHGNLLASLRRLIISGFDWRAFPTFCAVLVGGSTLLEVRVRGRFVCRVGLKLEYDSPGQPFT